MSNSKDLKEVSTNAMYPSAEVGLCYYNLIEAVREIGVKLVARQVEIHQSSTFVRKADRSIVTDADLESEQYLMDAIFRNASRPYVIISEEVGSISTHDGPSPATWYLDPIDGTASYASGNTDYAILLSEWRFERPLFSIVYYPATRELRWAFNTSDAAFTSDQLTPTDAGVIQVCYIRDERLRAAVIQEVGEPCVLHELESTRALFDLSAGKIGGVIVFLCGHGVWDLAALAHLVTASGCYLRDENGNELTFKNNSVECSYLIAAQTKSKGCALRRAVEVFRHGSL